VTFAYRGLRDLNVIHDELEDGAELIYSEQVDVDEATIRQWISHKEALGAFASCRQSLRPDCSSKGVARSFSGLHFWQEGRRHDSGQLAASRAEKSSSSLTERSPARKASVARTGSEAA
jgi:hypothetical protein